MTSSLEYSILIWNPSSENSASDTYSAIQLRRFIQLNSKNEGSLTHTSCWFYKTKIRYEMSKALMTLSALRCLTAMSIPIYRDPDEQYVAWTLRRNSSQFSLHEKWTLMHQEVSTKVLWRDNSRWRWLSHLSTTATNQRWGTDGGGKGVLLDNRSVVPYDPYLSKRFKAHINVERCSSISAFKYLFKYVFKGGDRTTGCLPDIANCMLCLRYISAAIN
jgi:hypothetical protein